MLCLHLSLYSLAGLSSTAMVTYLFEAGNPLLIYLGVTLVFGGVILYRAKQKRAEKEISFYCGLALLFLLEIFCFATLQSSLGLLIFSLACLLCCFYLPAPAMLPVDRKAVLITGKDGRAGRIVRYDWGHFKVVFVSSEIELSAFKRSVLFVLPLLTCVFLLFPFAKNAEGRKKKVKLCRRSDSILCAPSRNRIRSLLSYRGLKLLGDQ